ncbi:MAG: homoprotocatechuate degradation operon regulator HpaR [Acidiferrobacteraceae bacterium]|jgi:homoprotocatechuate degradation regulator HpaR|nr:homoprotocatechuate degradation operon regulator HpaR [Acidiferrobacteraceae bacterium]MBT5981812.1 homoprotocatechuate degradation operon regulator HpaR [Acidiferrobacteraceae bacterium]
MSNSKLAISKKQRTQKTSHGINDFSHTLPIRLLRARQAAISQFRPIYQQYDVTEQQWRVLRMVTSSDSLTVGDLSRAVFISMPSLSRIMTSLEKRKLIRRKADKRDLRKMKVSATSAGQAMVTEAALWSDARYDDIARWFGKKRLKELQILLDDLAQILNAHQ